VRSSESGHILIVEDDGDLLEVLRFVLEDEGYRVSTAKGGAEALEIAKSEELSLILLDVTMPDIDGLEVAKRLRADPATANIRLALHTGLEPDAIRARFSDYDAFIAKTEDSEKLVDAVKAAFEQPGRVA
jgi:two-component system phosphate regulon response regulator PhoB